MPRQCRAQSPPPLADRLLGAAWECGPMAVGQLWKRPTIRRRGRRRNFFRRLLVRWLRNARGKPSQHLRAGEPIGVMTVPVAMHGFLLLGKWPPLTIVRAPGKLKSFQPAGYVLQWRASKAAGKASQNGNSHGAPEPGGTMAIGVPDIAAKLSTETAFFYQPAPSLGKNKREFMLITSRLRHVPIAAPPP